jgi:hypothetical protein
MQEGPDQRGLAVLLLERFVSIKLERCVRANGIDDQPGPLCRGRERRRCDSNQLEEQFLVADGWLRPRRSRGRHDAKRHTGDPWDCHGHEAVIGCRQWFVNVRIVYEQTFVAKMFGAQLFRPPHRRHTAGHC